MTYQVHLPNLDAHRLNATRNPSQTSVCLKTAEKTSQQPAYTPEQEQSTIAETSFIDDRHPMDEYEAIMDQQAAKERIPIGKRVKSRKLCVPKYLRREANKAGLAGFHKRVKRVPKDISFEVVYHKYTLGNFFKQGKETDKDVERYLTRPAVNLRGH
ncbi:unnamed protein product [Brassica rapa]|uniref:Uncharacterized protein n=1 Tax=Brassica campestris TaxID=3711 RepID=A0A3P6CNR2_BRACM|nr:unnamed protein product [Brassica rapa]VDD17266.1 unnamed protein product [Brassica rapa]